MIRSVPWRGGGWRDWRVREVSVGWKGGSKSSSGWRSKSGSESVSGGDFRFEDFPLVLVGMGKADGPSVRSGATERNVRSSRCWFDKIFRS